MTDPKDDASPEPYYKPWLKTPADAAGQAEEPLKRTYPSLDTGLKKPQDPPLGINLSAYVENSATAGKQDSGAADTAPSTTGTATDALKKAGAEAGKAAKILGAATVAGTQKLGQAVIAADIPGKIARLELGSKAKSGAHIAGDYLESAGKRVAQASRAVASRSKQVLEDGTEMLTPKLQDAARATQDATRKLATDAKNSVQRGAQAIRDKTTPAAVERPASALDDLVTHEGFEPIAIEGPHEQNDVQAAEPKIAQYEAPMQKPSSQNLDMPLFANSDAEVMVTPVQLQGVPEPTIPAPAPPVQSQSPQAQSAPPAQQEIKAPQAVQADQPSLKLPSLSLPSFQRPAWLSPQMALGSGIALGLAAVFALGMAYQSSRTDAAIRQYLLSNPEILPQAMAVYQTKQQSAAIAKVREPLERAFSGAWAGNPNGDVTMVVFTDYACTFCRQSAPDLARLLKEDKGLKIIYRELPIISPLSEGAARQALAAAKQGKYAAYHDRIMAASSLSEAQMKSAVAASGADVAKIAEMAKSGTVTQELNTNLQLARDLGITATPVSIIGDTVIEGAEGYAKLKAAVSKARGKA
jgi:protein-disulfide isomerase